MTVTVTVAVAVTVTVTVAVAVTVTVSVAVTVTLTVTVTVAPSLLSCTARCRGLSRVSSDALAIGSRWTGAEPPGALRLFSATEEADAEYSIYVGH